MDKNVLGGPLQTCSRTPLTGFHRDGSCRVSRGDHGVHGVCSQVTDEFLAFTRRRGNDLSTPSPLYGFPGLKAGDRWCLCASRWKEAYEHDVAPPVVLEATSKSALEYVDMQTLLDNSVIERQQQN